MVGRVMASSSSPSLLQDLIYHTVGIVPVLSKVTTSVVDLDRSDPELFLDPELLFRIQEE